MEQDEKIIKVILASPDDDANIGGVCRAMKTMGLHTLVIVGRDSFNRDRIRQLAIHAYDLFENAAFPGTLEEAVADSVFTAGFSRRRGKWRKYLAYSPEELALQIDKIETGTVSLVFGNEERGLTDAELSLCDVAVRIGSSPEFPSLNLSHAVQIAAYVIRNHGKTDLSEFPGRDSVKRSKIIPRERCTQLTEGCMKNLKAIGFFSLTGEEEMGLFFRDIFSRALLSEREAQRVEKIFEKIEKLKLYKSDTGSTSSSM